MQCSMLCSRRQEVELDELNRFVVTGTEAYLPVPSYCKPIQAASKESRWNWSTVRQ